MLEFKAFPKIHRFSREVIVTEKLDGTNAAIVIENGAIIGCQSRTRFITPQDDNYGFAAWALSNQAKLVEKLGDGTHFGEWWGLGLQRRYNMTRKVFSLFNTTRWVGLREDEEAKALGLWVVPELWRGEFSNMKIDDIMSSLLQQGSVASQGFMNPEGVVIYHTQGNFLLKKTFEKDKEGKGQNDKPASQL